MSESCVDCRFSHQLDRLRCRRFPPFINKLTCSLMFPEFPIVGEHEWCGEFQSDSENEDNYNYGLDE